MKVVFSALAAKELQDTREYYELEFAGLGERFVTEVKLAIERIVQYPTAWSVERGDVRRNILPRFPYKLLYSVEPDHIFVIAIAHQHRKPDYWVDET